MLTFCLSLVIFILSYISILEYIMEVFRIGYLLVQCQKYDLELTKKLLPKNVLMYNSVLDINLVIENGKWKCKSDLSPVKSISRKLKSNYSYFPVVYSYNKNRLRHKGAIFISRSGTEVRVLFYEPYGIYSKYNMDYLSALQAEVPGSDSFHNYYRAFKTQSFVLATNNGNSDYAREVRLINPDPDFDISDNRVSEHEGKKYREPYDATYSSFKLLETVNNDTLRIFGTYNSKICVTITLVETWHHYRNTLPDFHNRLKTQKRPSLFIMNELKKILESAKVDISAISKNAKLDNLSLCAQLFS